MYIGYRSSQMRLSKLTEFLGRLFANGKEKETKKGSNSLRNTHTYLLKNQKYIWNYLISLDLEREL